MPSSLYRRYGKRCLDVALATGALLLLSPILAVTTVLVRLKLGSPVLFCQRRPGRDGRLFTVLKFRSMSDATDSKGRPLPDEERLTRFGRFLRSSSIDELPELWNVVRGEMSLVGPRPWMPHYLEFYTDEQSRRHDVRPGITGWAQINGRNRAAWHDRLEMDVWYVDHCSFRLDLKILVLTVVKVLRRSDISAEGHATMTPFAGNPIDGSATLPLPVRSSEEPETARRAA